MMLWFLMHIDQHLDWRGMKMLAYRYWHPTDHIFFKIIGKPGPSCRFHVVEAFQANPKYLIDIAFDVPKLDLTGFRLEVRRLGQVIMSMDEAFEEIANSITSGIASALSVAALVAMVVHAALRGDGWHVTGCAIFGASLIVSNLSSTLYHAIAPPRAKRVFLPEAPLDVPIAPVSDC